MFDNILAKNRYILGYHDGGDTIKEGTNWTYIGSELYIAEPTVDNRKGFELITEIILKANIKLDVQENMLHWLWVHNAGSILK